MPIDQIRSDAAFSTIEISGSRNVPEDDGQFLIPTDTAQSSWDLDPTNGQGDLVIPDDIDGRSSSEAPKIGDANAVTFLIESQESPAQNLSLKVEHLDGPGGTVRATEDKNDSDLFGPDTSIRLEFIPAWPWAKVTVTSEVSDGTQNRVNMIMETH